MESFEMQKPSNGGIIKERFASFYEQVRQDIVQGSWIGDHNRANNKKTKFKHAPITKGCCKKGVKRR